MGQILQPKNRWNDSTPQRKCQRRMVSAMVRSRISQQSTVLEGFQQENRPHTNQPECSQLMLTPMNQLRCMNRGVSLGLVGIKLLLEGNTTSYE